MRKEKIKKFGIGLIGTLIAIGMLGSSCDVCEPCIDDEPPARPRGVRTITRDGAVEIYWHANEEPDLAGYYVYRNTAPSGYFRRIGITSDTFYIDHDVVNGETYFYAVSAFDIHGNESPMSDELAHDTPRPEGTGVILRDFRTNPESAGWDFSAEAVVSYDSPNCDIFYEYDTTYGISFMNAGDNTLIQDFGYTEDLHDVDYAPTEGWSSLGWVELIVGHTYIVWTRDNHFAMFRITALGDGYCEFEWAYQVDPGNRELVFNGDTLNFENQMIQWR